MGRAARWLRGLLGGGKKAPLGDPGESPVEPRPGGEKKKWPFGKSIREKGEPQPRRGASVGVPDERWGASYREGVGHPASAVVMDEDEQSMRAIAVAAATAAVAEAAVAAAHAAAAVVKLTSSGRAAGFGGATIVGRREEWAAVKIQSAFRGYLSRRALRALKGLVKLQALVRGNIVRKQAAETLRCMQALVRVQARAQARRALQTEKSKSEIGFRTHAGPPPTPENYEQAAHVGVTRSFRSGTHKGNASKPSSVDAADRIRANSTGWNWSDRRLEERYRDIRESTKKAGIAPSMDDDRNSKILEVDPGKPQINHRRRRRRRSNHYHSFSTMNSHSFATMPDSPSKDSTAAQQSVPSSSSVDMQQSTSTLRYPLEAEGYSESPHLYSASSRPGSSRRGPFTPSKSECSQSFFFLGYSDYPNYMANTECSKAKVRSLSAPKQRAAEVEKSSSMIRSSAHIYGQQTLAQRSSSLHAKFTNKAYPGSCRLDTLDIPTRY